MYHRVGLNFSIYRHDDKEERLVKFGFHWPENRGLAQAYWQIIIGRIITGFAASGMTSVASIIITGIFYNTESSNLYWHAVNIAPPSDVAILRSYVNLASTFGLSLGGPLGGYLAGTIGWRWSFIGQVPIAVLCCLLIRWSLEAILTTVNRDFVITESVTKSSLLNFDFPGALSLAIAVTSFLVIFDLKTSLAWSHVLVRASLITGLLSILVFFVVETHTGKRKPLIPLWLLRTEVGAFCAAQMLILGGRYAVCMTFKIVFFLLNDKSSSRTLRRTSREHKVSRMQMRGHILFLHSSAML